MKRCVSAAIAVIMMGGAWAAQADVVITLKSENVKTHRTKRIKLYAKGNRVAYRAKDGSGMIFDGDRQTSWNYDTRHGIYVELDADSARIIRERARQAAKEREKTFRQEMAELPTEERKIKEQHFQSLQEAPHYKRLGPRKKVGQWRCAPVARVDGAGAVQERMCIASFKELGIGPEDQKVFESMDKFVSRIGPDHHSAHSRFTLQAEDELGLHGVAVRDQYAGVATKIVSVRHEKISDAMFQLPKGLKKISLFTP